MNPLSLSKFLAEAQSYFYPTAVNLIILGGESGVCGDCTHPAAHQPLRTSLVLGHLGKASLNYVPN